MAAVEPIIVVLGPWCGGTSAVAAVLHHLGVFMGTEFDFAVREPHQIWEDLPLCRLCRRAFSEPDGQLQMDAGVLEAKLRSWADDHRRAARVAGQRPGVKNPLLCVAVDFIRDAWGPVVPVVVERPVAKVVASLNRLGWWKDEQQRVESTEHLIAARDLALAGASTVRVDFEALCANPTVVIRGLAAELSLEVTEAQVQAAADSVLKPTDVNRTSNRDPVRHGRDVLLAEVERNPEDAQSVFFLAQSYWQLGDFTNARKWYERRAELGGFDEETFFSLWQVAEAMAELGAPWQDVEDAYLKAWEFRPTRAEPLWAIARRYRIEQRYRLGYLFAKRAADIPFPEHDVMIIDAAVYSWRAIDEQAVCASWIDKQAEAFTLCRRMLARPDVPDDERQRITGNRDVCVPTMIEMASSYPEELAQRLLDGRGEPDVVVSLIAGPDRSRTEHTLNSFLHCCTDVTRVGRFLVQDTGLSDHDRTILLQRYGFLEFGAHSAGEQIGARFRLHLGEGWRFFAPENLITRLTAVLEAEEHVFQVGINFTDAVKLTGTCAPETAVRRAPEAGRYVMGDAVITGPAMSDTTRLDRAGGLRTATLDEVLCIAAI